MADTAPRQTISVAKDKSVPLQLKNGASTVVVTQPDVAEVVANNDNSVYVRGKDFGSTNILIYDAGFHLLEVVDVNVGFDAEAAQEHIEKAIPGEKVTVTNLGSGGLVLSGEAANTQAVEKARAIAELYAPKRVASEIAVTGPQQIILEVRIVEADRSALKDFGISFATQGEVTGILTNGLVTAQAGAANSLNGVDTPVARVHIGTSIGNIGLDAYLDALENKGLVHTLARPNLASMSGEKASFLAGGEFPFPVPNGKDNVTIEFKPFGVQLDFTPTVEMNGLIKLQVAPQVSQLDDSHPLRLNGFNVPSVSIRRTSTTVELKDGETFAIAGLYQQEYANGVREVPGLGELPILGVLFRSARWRRQETELVVLVTPRLAGGEESRAIAPDPLRVNNEPSALDVILKGSSLDQKIVEPVGKLRGPLQ